MPFYLYFLVSPSGRFEFCVVTLKADSKKWPPLFRDRVCVKKKMKFSSDVPMRRRELPKSPEIRKTTHSSPCSLRYSMSRPYGAIVGPGVLRWS